MSNIIFIKPGHSGTWTSIKEAIPTEKGMYLVFIKNSQDNHLKNICYAKFDKIQIDNCYGYEWILPVILENRKNYKVEYWATIELPESEKIECNHLGGF